MLGPAGPSEVAVWLQTHRACHARVRFWRRDAPSRASESPEVATEPGRDHIARFTLSGLEPGARYDYEVVLDGARIERPYLLSFRTQETLELASDPPAARFAIGSCAYVNDAAFDRPLANHGDKMEIFRSIVGASPDAMVWLGDNWYYREGDFFSERTMRARAAHTRALAELQPLLGSAHHYAIWDDHDYGENDSDRTSRLRDPARRVFADYWTNPSAGIAEAPGIFFRFTWSDAELFMLDDRSFRTPVRRGADSHGEMFGAAQMRWLEDALVTSRATFKIVAGGSQILNDHTAYECFARFPEERRRFFDVLRDRRIEGVVFLSGDRHHTELIRRSEPGIYPLYDFTSSALTSRGGRIAAEASNPDRVPGTWLTGIRNFGLLDLSGPRDRRTLTLRAIDFTGTEQWTHEIPASELRFAT
jgi:alkaline phosphatase D